MRSYLRVANAGAVPGGQGCGAECAIALMAAGQGLKCRGTCEVQGPPRNYCSARPLTPQRMQPAEDGRFGFSNPMLQDDVGAHRTAAVMRAKLGTLEEKYIAQAKRLAALEAKVRAAGGHGPGRSQPPVPQVQWRHFGVCIGCLQPFDRPNARCVRL